MTAKTAREHRENLGVSLQEVQDVIGLSKSYLSQLENPRDPEATLPPHIEKRYLKALETVARGKATALAIARRAFRAALATEGAES